MMERDLDLIEPDDNVMMIANDRNLHINNNSNFNPSSHESPA